MPKTTAEHVIQVLDQGYDPRYVRGLYRQIMYAFGDDWSKHRELAWTAGRLVECPDVIIEQLAIGVSRRILNSQFISLSRVAYSQPDPTFTDVDRYIGEVRKQFLLCRADSEGDPDGEWQNEDAMAYMDGDGLGVGGCQIVLQTNPVTDLQKVSIQYVPATNIIWDRLERNPARSRWMAFVKFLGREEAQERFGMKVADRYVKPIFESLNGNIAQINPIEAMRVIEYYDTGFGKSGTPTMAVVADDLGGEVLEIGENVFQCVPFAPYIHFVAPGMRRPVGRVVLQMATQEALNEVEKRMRTAMKKGAVDLLNVDAVDQDDLGRYNDGDYDGPGLRMTPPPNGGKVWERIPGEDIANTVLEWKSMLETQFTTDSGTSEFERGNFSASPRTLGENQLVDERSKVQGVWSTLQMMLYHRRKVAKVLQIAALFDRDPVTLDILGHPVLINDPKNPVSSIDKFLAQKSRVVIDIDSLQASDLMMKRQQKLAELAALQGELEQGQINPVWYAQEMLKALGYDPDEAMRDAPATQPAPKQPDPNEKLMIDYKDAPPFIRRQMESAAGFQPVPAGQPENVEAQQPQGPQPGRPVQTAARP